MDSRIRARRLLEKLWKRAQVQEPQAWSLRRTAKKIGVSPGYLSLIFSGRKKLTSNVAESLLEALKTPRLEAEAIRGYFRPIAAVDPSLTSSETDVTHLVPQAAEWLLGKWYRLPLLDLLTTENCPQDIKGLGLRLEVPASEIEQSLRYLSSEGLASQDADGRWSKTFTHIRFPAATSRETIRNYHRSQLKRMDEILQKQVAPADYSKRLVIGLSLAVNMEALDEVKAELESLLYQAAHRLSRGPCQEVYQLNLQLAPQTRTKSRRE